VINDHQNNCESSEEIELHVSGACPLCHEDRMRHFFVTRQRNGEKKARRAPTLLHLFAIEQSQALPRISISPSPPWSAQPPCMCLLFL
jgi:hypothetical protein